MKKSIIAVTASALLIAGGLTACTAVDSTDRETIYQVSILQGLTLGDYHGTVSVKDLKGKGDTGIGTFDGLNGELVMVDGTVYRVLGNGSVEIADDDETVPFADITFFDADSTEQIADVKDFKGLSELLNKTIDQISNNRFYMVRIDGEFESVNLRSEYSQSEPYEPLADVLEHDQTFFDYEDIKGTVVGLYCPPYMSEMNATGWHLHFISEDKSRGGHVLNLRIKTAELKLDYTDGFEMNIPDNEDFNSFDLTQDQSEDIKKVETNKGE